MNLERTVLLVALFFSLYFAFQVEDFTYTSGTIKPGKSFGRFQEGVLEFSVFSQRERNCTVYFDFRGENYTYSGKRRIWIGSGETLVKVPLNLTNGTSKVIYHVKCD